MPGYDRDILHTIDAKGNRRHDDLTTQVYIPKQIARTRIDCVKNILEESNSFLEACTAIESQMGRMELEHILLEEYDKNKDEKLERIEVKVKQYSSGVWPYL